MPEAGWPVLEVPALGLAVGVPHGWQWSETDEYPLQLLGAPGAGYRPSVCFSLASFDPPTPQGARQWMRAAVDERAAGYPYFRELRRGTLEVGGCPAAASHHRWRPSAVGAEVDQLLVAVLDRPGSLVQIDAAALSDRGDPLAPARRIVTTVELDRPAEAGAG